MRRRQQNKRLSLISDIIIFLIVLLILTLWINHIDLTSVISQSEKYQEVLALNDENTDDVVSQNKAYIQKIKDKYNITIKYGDSVKQMAQKVSATELSDGNIVNKNIGKIETELEKYPDNFFNLFKTDSTKYSITIILLDKFSDSNLALASRNNLNEYKIYLSNTEDFSRAFEHEMFHIIEYYTIDITGNTDVFNGWNKLNPYKFSYDDDIYKLDNTYVYTNTFSLSNAFFVTKYSKTSPKEDRAETFAELMTQKNKPLYFNKNEHIYMKAKYISDIIGQNFSFNEAQEKLYWNKYLF